MFGLPIAAVFTLLSTAFSVYSGFKQAGAQDDALKAQQQADAIKQAREKRNVMREARIRAATINQNAANQGGSQTSAAIGGAASVESQKNANMSFLDQIGTLNNQATEANRSANKWGSYAAAGASFANLGATVFAGQKGAGSAGGPLAPRPPTTPGGSGFSSYLG